MIYANERATNERDEFHDCGLRSSHDRASATLASRNNYPNERTAENNSRINYASERDEFDDDCARMRRSSESKSRMVNYASE